MRYYIQKHIDGKVQMEGPFIDALTRDLHAIEHLKKLEENQVFWLDISYSHDPMVGTYPLTGRSIPEMLSQHMSLH